MKRPLQKKIIKKQSSKQPNNFDKIGDNDKQCYPDFALASFRKVLISVADLKISEHIAAQQILDGIILFK